MLRIIVVATALASAVLGSAHTAVAAPDRSAGTDSTQTSDTYYKNCAAARSAGAAPIHQGQPGYRSGLDRDGDGVACE